MRIFVAGATGVIGSRLVRALVERGHVVVGTTRSASKRERLRAWGAAPVVMDALDEVAVKAAVVQAAPDVVVHQLTSLPDEFQPRRFSEAFEATDRLRTEGTDHLMAAAASAGVRRVVAQSYASWPYARRGGPVKSEDDPLDPDPVPAMRRTLDAIKHVEASVMTADLEGIALRYGAFYGPGTSIGVGGSVVEAISHRRFPVVGSGEGVWSFVHVDDATEATVAAIQGGAPGIYNVVDDEPAPVNTWLPALASAIGARRPFHLAAWLARPLIGEVGVTLMTEIRGASNAKATHELAWSPIWSSWREGFREALH